METKNEIEKWHAIGSSVWSEYGCICVSINTRKNADLIAAAPELLEALKAAVDCKMVPITSAKDGGAAKHSIQVQVADQIRAAIAKATGVDNGN